MIPRNGKGQPLIIPVDGGTPVPYARASNLANALKDTEGLTTWKLGRAATGFANRPDFLDLVRNADSPGKLNSAVYKALDAGGANDAARRGTRLHKLLEDHDLGQTSMFTDPADQWVVDAWEQMKTRMGWLVEPRYVEAFTVCDELGVAGTPDRIVGGTIVDFKFGKNVDAVSWAVQLAVYANSTLYVVTDADVEQTGEVDRDGQPTWRYRDAAKPQRVAIDMEPDAPGWIAHMPAPEDACLLELDLFLGWEWALQAVNVRTTRSAGRRALGDRITFPVTIVPAQTAEPSDPFAGLPTHELPSDLPRKRQWLASRIDTLRTIPGALERVRLLWPADLPTLKQADTHTAADLATIEQILDRVETETSAPFHEPACSAGSGTAPEVEQAPRTPAPDEGERISDDELAALAAAVAELSPPAGQFARKWTLEAKESRHPIHITQFPTRRRAEIVRGIVAWAQVLDEDVARASVELAREAAAIGGESIGSLVALLDIDRASWWADLGEKFLAGSVPLTYTDDGTPIVG